MTGASSGIGKELAVVLHREGARLYHGLLDLSDGSFGGNNFPNTSVLLTDRKWQNLFTESKISWG